MDNPHYVTPEEAQETICPMSMSRNEFAAACTGSKCMAWRWKFDGYEAETEDDGRLIEKYSKTHGYCGMVTP